MYQSLRLLKCSPILKNSFQKRNLSRGSSVPTTLYNNVWRKSNTLYLTYIIVGCIALEGIYGTFTNAIWDTANSGVIFFNLSRILKFFIL